MAEAGIGKNGEGRDWAMWLRLLSQSVRDSAASATTEDSAILQAVHSLSAFLISLIVFLFFFSLQHRGMKSSGSIPSQFYVITIFVTLIHPQGARVGCSLPDLGSSA